MNTDDQASDIRGDPFLSAVDADLRRARKGLENGLLIALVTTAAAMYLLERTRIVPAWVRVLLIVFVLLGLVLFYLHVKRRQKKVADKHGLVCGACGYCPAPHMIMSAAMTQRCEKCRARLPLRVNSIGQA